MAYAAHIKFLIFGVLAANLIGCSSGSGGSGDDPSVLGNRLYGTCNHTNHTDPNQRHCREWHGSIFSSFALDYSCQGLGGVYSTVSCPSLNRVGVCYLGKDSPDEVQFVYYTANWSLASAESNCASKATIPIGGSLASTWIPEP